MVREYTCPSEIVHGFDLDSCQFVLVYKDGTSSLYATEIGLEAAINGRQWYDPEMVSTTYIHRLNKYSHRGISLLLPKIQKSDIVHSIYGINTHVYLCHALSSSNDVHQQREILTKRGIPRDIGTALIIISFFKISSYVLNIILNNGRRLQSYDSARRGMPDPQWIVSNPMKQDVLSGIFYPIDQEDVHSMYMKSPLFKDSRLSMPVDMIGQYPTPVVTSYEENGRWITVDKKDLPSHIKEEREQKERERYKPSRKKANTGDDEFRLWFEE